MQITWLFYLALDLQKSCSNPHQVVLYGYQSEASEARNLIRPIGFNNQNNNQASVHCARISSKKLYIQYVTTKTNVEIGYF